jgi:hypothetical protein
MKKLLLTLVFFLMVVSFVHAEVYGLNPMTRGEAAVYLLSSHGLHPVDLFECRGVFTDAWIDANIWLAQEPRTSEEAYYYSANAGRYLTQCAYIEMLYDLGVTVGCGGGNYCPGDIATPWMFGVFKSKLTTVIMHGGVQ